MMSNKKSVARDFMKELQAFIEKIEELDKATEWQPREPHWWLEMQAVETKCRLTLKDLEKRYGESVES